MSYNSSDLINVKHLKMLAETIRDIDLAKPTLTINKTNTTLNPSNPEYINFTTDSDGAISISSSDDTIATATINNNNNVITINPLSSGNAVISVSVAASSTYRAIRKNINVIVSTKTIPTLTLSNADVIALLNHDTTVTVNTNSDGAITVNSSSTNKATATINNDTITISGVDEGNATITVSIAESATYAAIQAEIAVAVEEIVDGLDLEDYTWAQIRAVGAAGLGAEYFDVGDTKTITLNGTVGTLALSNFQCRVFIIDFNYKGANGIYFQGFKTPEGVDIALCDSKYGISITDGTKAFIINRWGGNDYGGWKGCDLRYDILGSTDKQPSDYGKKHTSSNIGYDATSVANTSPVANTLIAALPSDLRSAIAAWTIYTDNAGDTTVRSDFVTTSIDYLPLLSEFEVQGSRAYANQYEQNQQAQMTYYANGNSKVKYRHDDTTSACLWWLRSPHKSHVHLLCMVYSDGGTNYINTTQCWAISPAFRIA